MQKANSTTKFEKEKVKLTLKNFKLSPDLQNFYRFIYENGLRREARLMMSEVAETAKLASKKKRAKKKTTKKTTKKKTTRTLH